MPQLAQVRGIYGGIRPSFRVHVNMSPLCMSKQSEAPKIGDGENIHHRHGGITLTPPRTSDRACVRFLTEGMISGETGRGTIKRDDCCVLGVHGVLDTRTPSHTRRWAWVFT